MSIFVDFYLYMNLPKVSLCVFEMLLGEITPKSPEGNEVKVLFQRTNETIFCMVRKYQLARLCQLRYSRAAILQPSFHSNHSRKNKLPRGIH